MNDEESPKPELSFADYGYTAFEKWKYRQIIYVQEANKTWIDFGESFYRATVIIIDRLANGHGLMDAEGVAAVFRFRHYLELALKRIVVRGRVLARRDKYAAWEDVKEVANIHSLNEL